MTDSITCDLAENAIDYLLLAGEQVKEGSPRMTKPAMATLWDGMELLLKARLESEDWTQLFNKPEQADSSKFQDGDFFSVGFDKLVQRLKDICDFEIEHQQAVILDRLRKTRNKIRHFAVTIDYAAAIALIVKTYSFAIDFIGEEFDQHLEHDLANNVAVLRSLLSEFEEFVSHRQSEIQAEIDGNRFSVFLDCPVCLQKALYADGGEAICLFCGRRRDGESIALEISDQHSSWMSPKDRLCSDPDVEECPECGSTACVAVGRLLEMDIEFVCLYCGESGDFEHCEECSRLYSGENIANRCDDCFGDLMNRND
jgi:hypothetical protein